ncbi:pyridoxamine 5'-phosphate oxidase [Sphingomonas xanthus]|uniref:Pyridoxine/pyridoxamine 5'-phosphate oxidase n=1 Tax=Sphingomonas xanthus TaxID=2594473 RepID=A0A516ISD5_9SPHN|nr:pyridoxamine 5'-phosphate oxidase [Sphingomonas xanthus]QDP19832.1 pyridoxamine 5'-phosphate oxidase [Sphingomonas xanthus]
MADDPIALFAAWFEEAKVSEPNDPDAVALATATASGAPSVRMVLLKGFGPDGFNFYTNADSRKGAELAANPVAALLFHWKSLRRQIRIEGPVEEVEPAEADRYFATRSRDSQLGAHASLQSRPLDSRQGFEARFDAARQRFDGRDVPRPDRWTGFRLRPVSIEFWSDRPHRLHERRLFERVGQSWREGLLYP